jgi:hypothetical protein
VKRILLRVDWHQVRDAVQLGLDKQSQLDHVVAIQAAIQVAIQLLVDWSRIVRLSTSPSSASQFYNSSA